MPYINCLKCNKRFYKSVYESGSYSNYCNECNTTSIDEVTNIRISGVYYKQKLQYDFKNYNIALASLKQKTVSYPAPKNMVKFYIVLDDTKIKSKFTKIDFGWNHKAINVYSDNAYLVFAKDFGISHAKGLKNWRIELDLINRYGLVVEKFEMRLGAYEGKFVNKTYYIYKNYRYPLKKLDDLQNNIENPRKGPKVNIGLEEIYKKFENKTIDDMHQFNHPGPGYSFLYSDPIHKCDIYLNTKTNQKYYTLISKKNFIKGAAQANKNKRILESIQAKIQEENEKNRIIYPVFEKNNGPKGKGKYVDMYDKLNTIEEQSFTEKDKKDVNKLINLWDVKNRKIDERVLKHKRKMEDLRGNYSGNNDNKRYKGIGTIKSYNNDEDYIDWNQTIDDEENDKAIAEFMEESIKQDQAWREFCNNFEFQGIDYKNWRFSNQTEPDPTFIDHIEFNGVVKNIDWHKARDAEGKFFLQWNNNVNSWFDIQYNSTPEEELLAFGVPEEKIPEELKKKKKGFGTCPLWFIQDSFYLVECKPKEDGSTNVLKFFDKDNNCLGIKKFKKLLTPDGEKKLFGMMLPISKNNSEISVKDLHDKWKYYQFMKRN